MAEQIEKMTWRRFLLLCRGLSDEAGICRFAGEQEAGPEGDRQAAQAFFSALLGHA